MLPGPNRHVRAHASRTFHHDPLAGDRLSPYFSFVDNPLASLPDAGCRVLSALHIQVRYARLLLWPAKLRCPLS